MPPELLIFRSKIGSRTIRQTVSDIEACQQSSPDKRAVLLLFLFIIAALSCGQTSVYAASSPRQLNFYHTHTKQSLAVIYFDGEHYIPAALNRIDHFLSDFRNGAIHPIDPKTLDILFKLQSEFGGKGTFEIISAYRSRETNEMLRKQGKGVAKRSQHVLGKAIDIRLRGVDTTRLRDAAIGLQAGGVGYYKNSDFVHVDSGRVRRW